MSLVTPFRKYTSSQLEDIAKDVADLRRYGFSFQAAFVQVTNAYTLEGEQLQAIENAAKVLWRR